MYRVGIIGCGGIAQVHAAALRQLPEISLIACADIRRERADAMAEKYGCRAYSSLEDLLAQETVDVLHLCTPHYLHASMALAAAKKGIAVFSEKPPVINWQQWDLLKQAAALAPLGICFQNRYNPNVRETERIIASGEYGTLKGGRAFVTWHREAPYYHDSGWRGTWETEGGGALINQSIHTLDLLVRLMGKADAVDCYMANRHLKGAIEVEDTVDAYLTLGGKPALFYATTAYTDDAPVQIELHLEKASLQLLGTDRLEIRTREGIQVKTFQGDEALGKGYWGNGHIACIADFYDSLTQKRPYQNDLASVANTVDAMLRMYEQGRKTLA